MKKITMMIVLIFSAALFGQRIKDISYLSGENSQQIIGYGLIVGLAGTGDTYRTKFTVQSVTSMLKRFGITVPQTDLRTRNVAAVMVTATLNPYLKPGAKFDVNVSSMGDASSLLGGILLMTPLSSMGGQVYAFAQGPVSIGGYDFRTPTGGRVAKNHALAGRVPDGGLLQKPLSNNIIGGQGFSVLLREPDMTTAFNIANAINSQFGDKTAIALDASEIKVTIPSNKQQNIVGFVAELESINVETDNTAKVVLNERTGTIVAGENVKIKPCTISYGSLNIIIRSYPIISQPGAFSNGTTAIFNNLVPTATIDSTHTIAISGASNVQEVAAALNSLKVSPQDIIAIFQALKEANALIGELVIL
ncbi:flagellar P-ring protein precursor [bacterium BMS3Abin03]|nr:flagellar P-ring protein precursor [bacterium BMS3Abin03]HDZ58906.1 flagellar basal body P-ring protein FlgI [Ignavibacteriales bacterium]